MKMHVMLLFLALISVACAEVKLTETIVPYDSEDDVVGEPLAPTPEEEDPAQILEELEQQIFDAVAREEVVEALALPRPMQPKSPKKCCKLGRQVAVNGLFCNTDLMQVEKRPNVIHRRKMKFHGPEVHGKTVYKDLMRRVEKCALTHASQSMFMKCCEWQEYIRHEMERCKSLGAQAERRQCRRRVQSRE